MGRLQGCGQSGSSAMYKGAIVNALQLTRAPAKKIQRSGQGRHLMRCDIVMDELSTISRGGGRGICGRISRSGEVDDTDSEWALVCQWMRCIGF